MPRHSTIPWIGRGVAEPDSVSAGPGSEGSPSNRPAAREEAGAEEDSAEDRAAPVGVEGAEDCGEGPAVRAAAEAADSEEDRGTPEEEAAAELWAPPGTPAT